MQCVNCGFENIPGMERCVRCSSSLELATVTIEPPRAGRRRVGSRLRRLWNPIRTRLSQDLSWLSERLARWLPDLSAYQIPWRALARTVIPGLGHIRYSNKAFGWMLLTSWLACFPLMFLTVGSTWNWAFLATAITIHVAAIIAFLGESLLESLPVMRAAFGVLLFLGLWAGVYLPAGRLLGQLYIALPVHGIAANSVFRDGDALLYEGAWLRPATFQRGDIVVYHIQAAAGPWVMDGLALDRIVGVPGDVVRIEGGRVLVNGQPAGPLETPIGMLPQGTYTVHVPPGQYMIVPSAIRWQAHGVEAGPVLMGLSLVSDEDVLGRVALRINPLSRFGVIR